MPDDPKLEPPVMTLISVKHQYGSKSRPLTLVSDKETADALTKLIERTGNQADVIDVPLWPAMLEEDAL